MVSIVVLVHNALPYVWRTFRSLAITTGVSYEVVAVDNRSRLLTRLLLIYLFFARRINRLCLLDSNTLYAQGNNIGAAASSRDAAYVLLLNSDIEVRDPLWLQKLLALHKRGATAYGVAAGDRVLPERADGFCFLIDRDLYLKYELDEQFEWWWSLTKLQATLLKDGLTVTAVRKHEDQLHHFGGKSGKAWRGARGMDTTRDAVREWFDGRRVAVVERI